MMQFFLRRKLPIFKHILLKETGFLSLWFVMGERSLCSKLFEILTSNFYYLKTSLQNIFLSFICRLVNFFDANKLLRFNHIKHTLKLKGKSFLFLKPVVQSQRKRMCIKNKIKKALDHCLKRH